MVLPDEARFGQGRPAAAVDAATAQPQSQTVYGHIDYVRDSDTDPDSDEDPDDDLDF